MVHARILSLKRHRKHVSNYLNPFDRNLFTNKQVFQIGLYSSSLVHHVESSSLKFANRPTHPTALEILCFQTPFMMERTDDRHRQIVESEAFTMDTNGPANIILGNALGWLVSVK